MYKRLVRGLWHSLTLLKAFLSTPKRTLLRQMVSFSRSLPQRFDQPLSRMMAGLTPGESANQRIGEWADGMVSAVLPKLPTVETLTADQIRALADAVAAWHFSSPLGICLRRSLLRYYFLRRAGLPVQIVFGARLKSNQEGGGIGGHAWLTLNDAPYFENPQDYAGFAPMFIYPQALNVERSTFKR